MYLDPDDARHEEILEPGPEYLPGRPVQIRVRVRGTQVDVDDLGGAVAAAGRPPGWREAAGEAVSALDGNMHRNGVICMGAPRGRWLDWIVERTAEVSAAACDAILSLGDSAAGPVS